jgi:nucleoside 2-deoxyribosyltransferase
MKVLRYENTIEEILAESEYPKIFLAGPTVRGNQQHLTSWRFEAASIFERMGFDGTLIVPEFTDRAESDLGKDWIVTWEFTGLKKADCIMFWIPRTRELIGLTTNFEMGYWMGRERDKMVYGRPNDAYRINYPDLMWVLDSEDVGTGQPTDIFTTLEDTISDSIRLANYRHNKSG